MRNAVIVAAADCVVFVFAFSTGNIWAAVGVIGLALAGLLLVAKDVRAQRREERPEEPADIEPGLLPDDFAPDIVDGDDGDDTGADGDSDEDGDENDVTGPAVAADKHRGDHFPFGEPLRVAEYPAEGRPR